MPKALEITGEKYFRLTAIESRGAGMWLFRCDCGSEVVRKAALVRFGNTKSCGCLASDLLKRRNTKHGLAKHPMYQMWAGMIQRCNNPNHVGYANYGGRGISVCERWMGSFEAFLEDMGERPVGSTIDRKQNDGNYEPGNCEWKTRFDQSRNTSRNVLVTIDGVTKTVRDWEIEMKVKRGTFQRRIDLGWDHDLAVTLPVEPGKSLEKRACP